MWYFSWCDAVHWSRDQSDIWWHHPMFYWHQTLSGGPTSHPPTPTWAALAACACFSCSLSSLMAWISFLSFIRLKQESQSVSLSGGGSPRLSQGEYFLSEDLRSPENVFNLLVPAPALCVGWVLQCLSPSLFMSQLGPASAASIMSLHCNPQIYLCFVFFVVFSGRGEDSAIIVTNETHSGWVPAKWAAWFIV